MKTPNSWRNLMREKVRYQFIPSDIATWSEEKGSAYPIEMNVKKIKITEAVPKHRKMMQRFNILSEYDITCIECQSPIKCTIYGYKSLRKDYCYYCYRTIDEFKHRYEMAMARLGWREMDSAPKDGTKIIGLNCLKGEDEDWVLRCMTYTFIIGITEHRWVGVHTFRMGLLDYWKPINMDCLGELEKSDV